MSFYDVTPANPISGITLHGGDTAVVFSGGTATDVVVNNGASITLSSGGTASFTTVSGGFEFISSGGAVTGTVLKGGTEAVSSGGVASFSVISGDGSQAVYSRGSALGAVLSGGLQAVYSGGSVSGTVVSNGGDEFVYAGGAATGTMVNTGGTITVNSGGSALFAAVSNGGTETVLANGVASFTMVSNGGFELVTGVVRNTVVSGGGLETVVDGGVASGTAVSGFLAAQIVSSGGHASGTVVDGTAATETVSSGGVVISTTLRAGFLYVSSGGTASFTTISTGFVIVSRGGAVLSSTVAGGFEEVSFSGVANFTTVISGNQLVLSGGVASNTVVSGGIQQIGSGGSAGSTVVSSGGSQQVRGGTAVGAVLAGGFQIVTSGGTASGTVVRKNGFEVVASGGTIGGTIVDSGGTLTVSSGGTVNFVTVSSGGSIDFPALVYSGGSAVIGDTDGLTVTEGGTSATLQLEGTYMSKTFQTTKDSGSGTVVTLLDSPRTLVWTGAQDTNFANAADWDDVTNGLNPAGSPPGAADTAQFLTSGGTITGTGTAGVLEFGGISAWDVDSSASLSAQSSVTVGQTGSGTLLVSGGASINGLGTSDDISGSSGGVASVTVTGTGSLWKSSGELVIGNLGTGSLSITNSANVTAAAAGSLPAMALGAGTGGSGSLLVTGAGSRATLVGQLDVGQAGGGTLTVSNQGTVLTGNDPALDPTEGFDIAQASGGSGVANVTGAGALLSNAGRFIVGDAGLGSLSIAAGGAVTTTADAIIANTASASGSSVNVTGAGSDLTVAGTLVVGAAGFGSLSLSQGAAVTAAALDVASGATGDGDVSLAGTGTTLTVSGALTLGDQAAGDLSILGGAQMTIGGGLVGGASGAGGNLDIEGNGSQLTINGGTLVVGGDGPAEFTLGIGATLTGELSTDLFGVTNEYGNVDPATDPNDGTQNVGFGNSLIYDFFIANSGTVKITSGTATFYTPLATFETGAKDKSVNGLWQIGASETLVMNATSVDNSQTFDLTSAGGATLVIGQVPAGNPNQPDTFNGQTMPTLTGSIAPGAANVLPGWDAPIENYASGDVITLRGLTYGSATASGDVVTVWSGPAGTGNDLGSLTFIDKGGNTDSVAAVAQAALAAAQINAVACFAAGTRIGTVDGWRKVEDLAVGDDVRTVLGGSGRVVWIGSRAVDCARHPRPETVWPVRISAGAFGENVPVRDLYLSPDHAVFVNEVLVPVKLLVNGSSITQVKRNQVVYHHVELEQHDVVLAEGLAVESYLDTGDRAKFSGGAVITLHPDFTAWTWEMAAAPLIVTGAKLAAVRRWVNARAAAVVAQVAVA